MIKKIKVMLVCVCYNSYEDAKKFLNSLNDAYSEVNSVELFVVFCDNSTKVEEGFAFSENKYCFDFFYKKNENLGYFPAVRFVIENFHMEVTCFDYVVVCNVDLIVDRNFFYNLYMIEGNESVGVIAPQIFSLRAMADLNPKIINRPPKRKLKFNKVVFKNSFLFCFYSWLSEIKKAKPKNKKNNLKVKYIYAAHGSFFIFTKKYFMKGGFFNYPRFLFGEEIFVAEEMIRLNLLISYEPSLKIYDDEHGSTSRQNKKFISNEHVKSYEYLIDTYFD